MILDKMYPKRIRLTPLMYQTIKSQNSNQGRETDIEGMMSSLSSLESAVGRGSRMINFSFKKLNKYWKSVKSTVHRAEKISMEKSEPFDREKFNIELRSKIDLMKNKEKLVNLIMSDSQKRTMVVKSQREFVTRDHFNDPEILQLLSKNKRAFGRRLKKDTKNYKARMLI